MTFITPFNTQHSPRFRVKAAERGGEGRYRINPEAGAPSRLVLHSVLTFILPKVQTGFLSALQGPSSWSNSSKTETGIRLRFADVSPRLPHFHMLLLQSSVTWLCLERTNTSSVLTHVMIVSDSITIYWHESSWTDTHYPFVDLTIIYNRFPGHVNNIDKL